MTVNTKPKHTRNKACPNIKIDKFGQVRVELTTFYEENPKLSESRFEAFIKERFPDAWVPTDGRTKMRKYIQPEWLPIIRDEFGTWEESYLASLRPRRSAILIRTRAEHPEAFNGLHGCPIEDLRRLRKELEADEREKAVEIEIATAAIARSKRVRAAIDVVLERRPVDASAELEPVGV